MGIDFLTSHDRPTNLSQLTILSYHNKINKHQFCFHLGNDETFQNVVKFLEELQQKSSDDEDDVLTPMCRVQGEDAEEKAAKAEVSRIIKMMP